MSTQPGADAADADRYSHLDAAFVLGALSDEDHAEFSRHLLTCPRCAAAVDELAELPGLLARVPAEEARRLGGDPEEPPADVPDTILPAVLDRARASRRRRWRVAVSGGAAAAVIALGAVVATVTVTRDAAERTSRPAATPVAMRPVGQDLVTATASFAAVDWGTRIELRCGYRADGSYREPIDYALVVTDDGGRTEQVATWTARAGRTVTIPAATRLRAADISVVDVRTPEGRVVLTVRPPGSEQPRRRRP